MYAYSRRLLKLCAHKTSFFPGKPRKLTWNGQEMISRSAGQGADHASNAETGDVNGAGDSAGGEEDHVYEAGRSPLALERRKVVL